MSRAIIGVDEVGRGCLAGPVVCAAVLLYDKPFPWLQEIRDSKKLSPKKRQKLSELITKHSIYAIREGSSQMIDEVNILQATLRTMKECVDSVINQGGEADLVLVDGNHEIPGLSLPQQTIEGGDDLHKAIGAASIIAKVYRDTYMVGMDQIYPEYGFSKHKGYGTQQHREAIMMYGPCEMHRMTFKGVFEYVKG